MKRSRQILRPIILAVQYSLVIFLVACKNSDLQNTGLQNTIQINEQVNFLQLKIDSATALYTSAIDDVKKGIPRETIILMYEAGISKLYHDFNERFDSLSNLLNKKKLTYDEYELIKSSINLDTIQVENNKLLELGVQLNIE